MPLKLYNYDHCPYCVKARMIFGLKRVPFKLITLADDDIKTPKALIGVKQVPILEIEKGNCLPESLDIIRHIDKNFGKPIVSWKEDKKLRSWITQSGSAHYFLAAPRWVKAELKEFKTASARRHFKNRMESYLDSFSTLIKETPQLIEEVEERLEKLEKLFSQKESQTFWYKNLSLNDFHLFAYLRTLTIVKGLKFPKTVKSYLTNLSKKSKVPLHFSKAL